MMNEMYTRGVAPPEQTVDEVFRRHERAIEELRRRLDERLRALDDVEAGERFREMMDRPIVLDGKVKAGALPLDNRSLE